MMTPIKEIKGQFQELKTRDKAANDLFSAALQGLDSP